MQKTPAAGVERIERLLTELSLAEKVGQMTQISLADIKDEAALMPALDLVKRGRVGSFLNAPSREIRNRIQRVAVESSRAKLPLLFGRDVIHGYRTVFPIPLGQAASFEPELARLAARATAREASEAGIDWTFAPMVDVTRDPRWGRVAEGYGEDPLLAAEFGVAAVRGFQGEHPGAAGSLAACAKHYLAYGATEAGKEYNTTWVPERLLRDLYLPPFRACVKAGVMTVMCGFNDLNGVPMSAHRWALRDVLKGELGFQGFVVSDWESTHELIAHGFCADDREVARASALAGVDLEMVATSYSEYLEELVESGQLNVEVVNHAVRRILTIKHQLGLFEHPYSPEPSESIALSSQHLALARQAARSSLVLLKNQGGCLPLTSAVKVALVGPLADDVRAPLGCWALDGDVAATVTLRAALTERLGAEHVEYVSGLPAPRSEDTSGFEAACAAVMRADLAIVVVGEDENISGECRSRAFLDLPGAQRALLERLATTGKPLVTVIMAGRPLTFERELGLSHALLYAWHGGTMAGAAITDVLVGDAAPSGKLPITFPRTVGQVPIYYNHKNTGRPPKRAGKGIPAGTPLDPVDMDSSYLDVEVTPQFPFGYGLSYTAFEYSEVRVSSARIAIGDAFEVSALVTNVGSCAGSEVVQVYVRDRVGSVTRPVRELVAFRKLALGVGEKRRVEFVLQSTDLGFCGLNLEVRPEAGMFDVYVGGDSTAQTNTEFELFDR
jgi:beta-glucosidase